MSSDLQTNIKLLINRSTNYRRFFHLAYTGQLPLYSLIRHADFVRLVLRNRTFLENIARELEEHDIHDPDFALLIGGECSCMAEQREFDASIDGLCCELRSLLKDAYQLSPSQQVAQLAIDSQTDFVRLLLRYIWDEVCNNLFLRGESVKDVERNFPGFVEVLTSNIEFFEPVLSSLPEISYKWNVRIESALKCGKVDVNTPFRQEFAALQSLLCDLVD